MGSACLLLAYQGGGLRESQTIWASHRGRSHTKTESWRNFLITKHFRYLKWRYSTTEAVFEAYVRENPPSKLPYKAQDSCMFWHLKLLVISGHQLVRCTWFCRGCFANIESSSSETSQMSFSFNIKQLTTFPYVGVSLNGGTPKTPQNDHF